MKLVTGKIFRTALLGLGLFAAGLLWMAIGLFWEKRNDPPDWIIDRVAPLAPRLVAAAGGLTFLGCVFLAAVKGVHRLVQRFVRRKESRYHH